jgi:hypothetical protein
MQLDQRDPRPLLDAEQRALAAVFAGSEFVAHVRRRKPLAGIKKFDGEGAVVDRRALPLIADSVADLIGDDARQSRAGKSARSLEFERRQIALPPRGCSAGAQEKQQHSAAARQARGAHWKRNTSFTPKLMRS